MIDTVGKAIALVISILTIRQLNTMNRKTKLEIEKLRLEILKLRGE